MAENDVRALREAVVAMRAALFQWLDYAEIVCDEDADEDRIESEFQKSVTTTSEALSSRPLAEFIGQGEQEPNPDAGKPLKSWDEIRELAESYQFQSDGAGRLSGYLEMALDEIEKLLRKR